MGVTTGAKIVATGAMVPEIMKIISDEIGVMAKESFESSEFEHLFQFLRSEETRTTLSPNIEISSFTDNYPAQVKSGYINFYHMGHHYHMHIFFDETGHDFEIYTAEKIPNVAISLGHTDDRPASSMIKRLASLIKAKTGNRIIFIEKDSMGEHVEL